MSTQRAEFVRIAWNGDLRSGSFALDDVDGTMILVPRVLWERINEVLVSGLGFEQVIREYRQFKNPGTVESVMPFEVQRG